MRHVQGLQRAVELRSHLRGAVCGFVGGWPAGSVRGEGVSSRRPPANRRTPLSATGQSMPACSLPLLQSVVIATMSGKAAKCPELARQQKREANARHRARKKVRSLHHPCA